MTVVSMSYLLEAGVHFGHQTKRWNPKMKEYIYSSRDDIYIIDLQKTAKLIEEAYIALKEIAARGGKILFVGTRKQASDAIREEAERVNMYYVNERWLGGTLTNFKTIRKRIKYLEDIEAMEKNGTFEVLPKKEVIGLKKEHDKLNKILCGIREMNKLPEALIIVDPSKEDIAIREARRLNIPVFGIVDTNCDPDMVDYVIPGNDDAIRAVKLIISVLANAVAEANGLEVINYVNSEDKQDSTDIMQKAVDSVKRKEERPRSDKRFDRPFRRDDRRFEKREFKKPLEKKEEVKVEVKEETTKEVKKEVTEEVVTKEVAKEVKKETVKKEKAQDLKSLTVAELRELAKTKELKGYSTMKKDELIQALK